MTKAFAGFSELSAHLDALGMFSMDLTLDRARAALERLGLSRPDCVVAHVLGTNGKGSTALYIAELARAHGVRAGLYLSPHFVSIRERLRIDGRMLSEAGWTALGNQVQAACADLSLTYFEFITTLALLAFARAGVGLAVLEAGLGGRYDAVTALAKDRKDLTVYTPIGLDHEAQLGDSVARVALDKCGAMCRGSMALTGPQAPEAERVLHQAAGDCGAALFTLAEVARSMPEIDQSLAGLTLPMPGGRQRDNARLALAAYGILAGSLDAPFTVEASRAALARAALPGRLQRAPGDPELILDAGHNPPALEALAQDLAGLGVSPAALVFTCLKDKNLERMRETVRGLTTGPIFVPRLAAAGERGRDAAETAALLGPRARATQGVAEALDLAEAAARAGRGPALACGSLYLLADIYALRPGLLPAEGPDFHIGQ